MGYRQIDAERCFRADKQALRIFVKAWRFDCGGNDGTFLSVYGWNPLALQNVKQWAGV